MVCDRCKLVVKAELEKLGLSPLSVQLGVVQLQEESIPNEVVEKLKNRLKELGFEIIDDRRSRLIEGVKKIIIELLYSDTVYPNVRVSDLLADKLHYDYSYLSRLFSETEGITIEHYLILQKTERTKELIIYDELTLSDIAYQLGYSSTAYLSAQFKKVTGMTPGTFRKQQVQSRKELDKVGKK